MKPSYKDNPSEIIDKLLEYHDIKTLRGILNSKARKKEPRGNNYFKIAVDVQILKHHKDSKLEWAINEIAEQNNISDKTVKNHINKFRKEMKRKISLLPKEANYSENSTIDVKYFIDSYIAKVYDWLSDGYGNLYEPDRPYIEYKKILQEYTNEIIRHANIPEVEIDEDSIPF